MGGFYYYFLEFFGWVRAHLIDSIPWNSLINHATHKSYIWINLPIMFDNFACLVQKSMICRVTGQVCQPLWVVTGKNVLRDGSWKRCRVHLWRLVLKKCAKNTTLYALYSLLYTINHILYSTYYITTSILYCILCAMYYVLITYSCKSTYMYYVLYYILNTSINYVLDTIYFEIIYTIYYLLYI